MIYTVYMNRPACLVASLSTIFLLSACSSSSQSTGGGESLPKPLAVTADWENHTLTLPNSVIEMFQGALGIPAGGWPKTMTETAELTAKDGKGGDGFGQSVVVSGRAVTAGAPVKENGQGAAYVFSEPTAGWQSTSSAEEITASDGAADDYFGWSVAIGDGVLVVGAMAYTNSNIYGNGAAYVFGKSQ